MRAISPRLLNRARHACVVSLVPVGDAFSPLVDCQWRYPLEFSIERVQFRAQTRFRRGTYSLAMRTPNALHGANDRDFSRKHLPCSSPPELCINPMLPPCVCQGAKAWLFSVLAMGLWTLGTSRKHGHGTNEHVALTGELELEVGEAGANMPKCTVEDLLPRSSPYESLQWTEGNAAEARYDCTCAATKAR